MSDPNGLQKIIDRILDEAREAGQKTEEAARAQAGQIKDEALAAADAVRKEAEAAAEKESAAYAEQHKNADNQMRRRELLKCRDELIEQVVEEAYSRIRGLDAAGTEAFLLHLIRAHAHAEPGIIRLGADDLARLPEDFASKAAACAAECGGTLTLSRESVDIDGGLILSYGDIDENYSLQAIFRERREEIMDTAQHALFS